MLYTASFKNINLNSKNNISIVKDKGKKLGYEIETYNPLVPKMKFKKVLTYNIDDNISKQEEYIKKYYFENLKSLDPKSVYNLLDNKVILSYENSDKFSHRQIVASWFEIFLDVDVLEITGDDSIKNIARNLEIKDMLENIIRDDLNSKYNSIRAYYLMCEGKKLEAKADIFMKQNNIKYASRTLTMAKEMFQKAEKEEFIYNKTYQKVRKHY